MENLSNMELSVVVICTGLVVVFIALALLILFITLLGLLPKLTNRQKSIPAPKAPPLPAAPAPAALPVVPDAPADDEGVSQEVVAVITAAIAASMEQTGGSFTIKSIKRQREARPVWGLAGITENTRPF